MTRNETAKQIDLAAADWAARLDRGELSPEDDKALESWLAGDPRRAGAFARAQAVLIHSERARALGPGFDPQTFLENRKRRATGIASLSRRQLLWGGTAIAAGLGGAVALGVGLSAQGETYSTQRGEMKILPLADGSVITLNTESRLRVIYTTARRAIHLEEGEALFDVAKDRARPFVVFAGETQVSAVGTSFTVRRLAGAPVEVLVREGIVEVNDRLEAAARPVRLLANMRATAAPAGQAAVMTVSAVTVAPVEIERAMAWREGRIAFEGETLKNAASEFQRYSETRIVIDDPQIAGEEIIGLFQANDPVGFARAVASSFGLHADVSEKQVRLYR